MDTDAKFFTNDDTNSLLERFKKTLNFTRFFDVLSGYFRSSGFGLLAEALANVEKIRILVGMETEKSVEEAARRATELESETLASSAELREEYSANIRREFETAPEDQRTEDSICLFIKFIREGKLEIRGHPSRNIHAKVYISRYYKDLHTDFGTVITGSSNFTSSGLVARREFNVQLKDDRDVSFALERFEKLWDESVELTREFIDTATKKTWLNDSITPYELYLKFLYEYFREDINAADELPVALPDDFQDLEYQRQAVVAAKKILDAHNGVFLADVVGLGKTFIASMLLQTLPGRKLVVCPPALKPYWEETLRDFYVHPAEVVSIGKIADIIDPGKYSHVVVDESHRFRNEETQSYEILKKICLGKKVILLSATPLNNRLGDLLAQLKLFQKGRASTIPGVANLEAFFRRQEKALAELNPALEDDRKQAERISALARDRVLKHVMIRRTRKEVSKYFGDDLAKNNLEFPDVESPVALVYAFDAKLDDAFNKTIQALKKLAYARYAPLLYLKSDLSQIDELSQKNIKGFIKSLLVKRLESSFYAFRKTLERIAKSYEAFIEAFANGKVYIGKQVDVGDILDSDDLEEMEEKLALKGVEIYDAAEFDQSLLTDLRGDLSILKEIKKIWQDISADPKFDAFRENLLHNENLKEERVLVFTESRETGEYIYSRLQKIMPGNAAMYSSGEAIYNDRGKSPREARELIRRNFDPSSPAPSDDFQVLISTDALAEGMNLHRAARIINYDLPWNPTRVMQRLGRVNRVGTKHEKIYIFNFFPTAQADSHLGLQNNIAKKIDAFNSVLGNDNKILFEDENPDPHGLFRKLAALAEEDDEDSELEYLREIRDVRDNDPEFFEKIKRLPLKARSAYATAKSSDELLIFFREGYLKKFAACGKEIRELGFLEAAPLFRASPDAKRAALPADYYSRLRASKEFLDDEASEDLAASRVSPQKRRLLDTLSGLRSLTVLTDEEQEYLAQLYKAVSQSSLAKNTIKSLSDLIKRPYEKPLLLFNAFRSVMPSKTLAELQTEEAENQRTNKTPRQIVLCQYLAPKQENQA